MIINSFVGLKLSKYILLEIQLNSIKFFT